MRADLRARVAELRSFCANSEVAQWPTCLACTDATYDAHPSLGHTWVPVASYRVEPDLFNVTPLVGGGSVVEAKWFYPARERDSRGWFKVIAECHGHEAVAEIDVPTWWGHAHVMAAIQSLLFFGQDRDPSHGLVTRIT